MIHQPIATKLSLATYLLLTHNLHRTSTKMFRKYANPPRLQRKPDIMDLRNTIATPQFACPLPKSHSIVLVSAKTAWHADQTKSNATLPAGATFAELRAIDGIIRICPTVHILGDDEDV